MGWFFFSGTKYAEPTLKLGMGIYPGKCVRVGHGTSFGIPEVAGTVYDITGNPRVLDFDYEYNMGSTKMVPTDDMSKVMEDYDKPPCFGWKTLLQIDTRLGMADYVGRFHPISCDIRPLLLNVALYELARVPFVDFLQNPLTADQFDRPTRTRTMSERHGEYIAMRAGDLTSCFDIGEVPVTGGNWTIQSSTIISPQNAHGLVGVKNALWVEAHLPWCTTVVDAYPMLTKNGC